MFFCPFYLSCDWCTELVYRNNNSMRTISTVSQERAGENEGDWDEQYRGEVSRSKLKIPVIAEALPISVAEFFDLFIANDAPHSFRSYYESQGSRNLSVTNWSEGSSFLGASREIKFIKPLNVPGLPSTRCTNVQRFRRFGEQGLVVCESTQMDDVPGASTFTVEDMVAVRSISPGKISLEINFEVHFIKATYFRFMIENSTGAEMQKYFKDFFQHLKRVCEEHRRTHPNHSNHSGQGSSGSKRTRVSGARAGALSPRGSPATQSRSRRPSNARPPDTTAATSRESSASAKAVKTRSNWSRLFLDVWEECKEVGLKIFQITCACLIVYGIIYVIRTQQTHSEDIRRLLNIVAALSEQQKVLQEQLNALKVHFDKST